MASQHYTPKVRISGSCNSILGSQPFNRDNIVLAFGSHAKAPLDGQDLAGSGALVWEGEMLGLPLWN